MSPNTKKSRPKRDGLYILKPIYLEFCKLHYILTKLGMYCNKVHSSA
jgi:hypothetical protein